MLASAPRIGNEITPRFGKHLLEFLADLRGKQVATKPSGMRLRYRSFASASRFQNPEFWALASGAAAGRVLSMSAGAEEVSVAGDACEGSSNLRGFATQFVVSANGLAPRHP